MLAFTFLCISFLLSLVHASPLALRVVFSPHITSPNANSVWPVGSKQFVTWETADIPPDSELTNPNGKVILGHEGSDGSLNLDYEHPLAQNFKLRVGKIQITVPDVAPREDYLVVLMGDSGNASPAFAITKITGKGLVSSGTSSSVTQLTSLITTPIPITGPSLSLPGTTTVVEPSTTDSAPTGTSTSPITTATSPVTSPTTSATSGSSAGTSSGTSSGATPSSTQGNSASSVLKSTGLKMTFGLATLVLVLLI